MADLAKRGENIAPEGHSSMVAAPITWTSAYHLDQHMLGFVPGWCERLLPDRGLLLALGHGGQLHEGVALAQHVVLLEALGLENFHGQEADVPAASCMTYHACTSCKLTQPL